ncbi:succinyldiaminopimelate transaminase [Oryzihumus sp.]|uniref:succinyldiaminopimelate transaminase n=1 Tax=Oryzihumus sp. TaxID=1968903 RepID=UPI002EDA27FC
MQLPDFPWDSLASYKERASSHVGGLVDLSVGTPVDPTPEVVQRALCEAADAPGYPQTWGTAPLREAVAGWFARRRGVPDLDPDGVLPTVGSKELVAWLPTLLGLGTGDVVAFPEVAYPTYDVGARIAGASPLPMRSLTGLGPLTSAGTPRLMWVNSPSNPTGQVLGVEHLKKLVDWAREHGVVLAGDECYAELDWREGAGPGSVPSILDPRVTGGSHEGLLAVYSLSKQSNLAGYRAAFVAGDVALVRALLEVRKHAGMIVPWPVQQAMLAALTDDGHVAAQKERYRLRRDRLCAALEGFGLRVDHSEAGLYLWSTREQDCWETVAALADRGILVAPGSFYGSAGARHVRVALTATDERIDAAVARLG